MDTYNLTEEDFERIKASLEPQPKKKSFNTFLKTEINNKYSVFFLPSKLVHSALPKELQGMTHWIYAVKYYHKIGDSIEDCTGEIKTCEHCQKSKALFTEGKDDEARKLWKKVRYISRVIHNNEPYLLSYGKQLNDILIEDVKATDRAELLFFNPKNAAEYIINVKNKGGFPDYSTSRFTNVRKDLTKWLQ